MTEEGLQQFVATLSKKEKAQITAATSLDSLLPGSLGRTRLDAALRYKLGVANARVYEAVTFGDLCRLLGATTQNGVSPKAAEPQSASFPSHLTLQAGDGGKNLQVGIDLEPISAMSQTQDYWEDEFYKHTFTPREIAYALLQPSPQATFAGVWCAKEALRKADPALAQTEWTSLEVIHDASGKPSMAVDGAPVAGALSVSHAGEIAIAVFVAGELAQAAFGSVQDGERAGLLENVEEPPAGDRGSGRLNTAIAMLALLISMAALAVTLFYR